MTRIYVVEVWEEDGPRYIDEYGTYLSRDDDAARFGSWSEANKVAQEFKDAGARVVWFEELGK